MLHAKEPAFKNLPRKIRKKQETPSPPVRALLSFAAKPRLDFADVRSFVALLGSFSTFVLKAFRPLRVLKFASLVAARA